MFLKSKEDLFLSNSKTREVNLISDHYLERLWKFSYRKLSFINSDCYFQQELIRRKNDLNDELCKLLLCSLLGNKDITANNSIFFMKFWSIKTFKLKFNLFEINLFVKLT